MSVETSATGPPEANDQPCTFHGAPCRKCGGTERYIKDKRCVACGRARGKLHKRDPEINRRNAKEWRRHFPEKVKQLNKSWQEKNKEHTRLYHRTSKRYRRAKFGCRIRAYGLTLADYDCLLIYLNGKCAICGFPKRLDVDHDHDTGYVRGLLCPDCNSGLALFRHSTDIIADAIKYLEKHANRTLLDVQQRNEANS